jgi:hypothetical protein
MFLGLHFRSSGAASRKEPGMKEIIARSSGVFTVLAALPRAVVRGVMHIPKALAAAIEKHAIGK